MAFSIEFYSRSPKVGNPIASILNLKSNVWGIPAQFGLNPVFQLYGVYCRVFAV